MFNIEIIQIIEMSAGALALFRILGSTIILRSATDILVEIGSGSTTLFRFLNLTFTKFSICYARLHSSSLSYTIFTP